MGACSCLACGFAIFRDTFYQTDENMSEEKSTSRHGLICAEILISHVLPPSPIE